MTKISIITASFNSEDTIALTIRSVLRQTYTDYEYIIIDGGSTDSTLEIARSCMDEFGDRLSIVSQADKGIYDAMNKGIARATGDVVGFLNSDDFFTTDTVLEKIAEAFEDDRLDAVYGDIHFTDDTCKKVLRYYSSRNFRPWLLRYGFMPAHPSFYLRKKFYDRYGNFRLNYQIAADYEMMVRLFCKVGINAKYLDMDFVTMKMGGISTQNFRNKLIIIREDIRACRENGVYTNVVMICLKFSFKVFGLRPGFFLRKCKSTMSNIKAKTKKTLSFK